MPSHIPVLLLLLCSVLPLRGSHAQVYTYTPEAIGCSASWRDGDCWSKTALNEPSGCAENGAWPSFTPAGCQVVVVINDDLQVSEDVELGGTFTSLFLGDGAELTIGGNLTILGQRDIQFDLEASSRMKVTGALTLAQGGTSDQTILSLGGDDSGMLTVASIEMGNRSALEVLGGGAMTSEGPTEYSGNSSTINVTGFFRTRSLLVTGGRLHQFNTYGGSQVQIDENIDIRGDTQIAVGGTSEVYVGEDILVSGDATIIAEDQSKIYVCGDFPPPTPGGKTQEIDEGKFFPCSILPITLLDQQVEYHAGDRKIRLSWSTESEEDLEYFIVERAIGHPGLFKPLEEIPAADESKEINSYEYWDRQLPLFYSRIYYRLQQVGESGESEFIGEVLSLQVPGAATRRHLVWRLYPNPNRGDEAKLDLVDVGKYNGEPIDLLIFGSLGEVLSLKDSSLEKINQQLSAHINSLVPGLYFFHLGWGEESQVLKVLKK
ncbi:Por secretion system C-terminal sorting domain-containing protein [Cyclobacterium lianum]|uniref:Por secretion system C-terminal sorting domain-containing protein n=1 Tax=Cyclobacterium lianum TaxID=388280 RepID=A0A1M7KBX0_9BACT|nr:T9SS type A sorting domain-containing protein [Cyclobacterium lianum]SHM62493.1 Por secretion system C-terminal sorting domain-containing protein [Cyclobacterium lianum]